MIAGNVAMNRGPSPRETDHNHDARKQKMTLSTQKKSTNVSAERVR